MERPAADVSPAAAVEKDRDFSFCPDSEEPSLRTRMADVGRMAVVHLGPALVVAREEEPLLVSAAHSGGLLHELPVWLLEEAAGRRSDGAGRVPLECVAAPVGDGGAGRLFVLFVCADGVRGSAGVVAGAGGALPGSHVRSRRPALASRQEVAPSPDVGRGDGLVPGLELLRFAALSALGEQSREAEHCHGGSLGRIVGRAVLSQR